MSSRDIPGPVCAQRFAANGVSGTGRRHGCRDRDRGKLAFAAVNRLGERLPQTRALAGEKVSRHLGFGHQQVEAVERAGTTSTWHATPARVRRSA
ncbi:hypothetical protein I553_2763 [Mycobacterium xenopi 4042]|uniref:Uncharacterized protein n=1 Tax=Mycobacterium xenopi 4042 TaxID=1299334 RepID=X8AGY8_MYCXE|nr:hypothetical protein I553_2763 [Mycobacterium xenopi 4042]